MKTAMEAEPDAETNFEKIGDRLRALGGGDHQFRYFSRGKNANRGREGIAWEALANR